jgi:hypothetical protein
LAVDESFISRNLPGEASTMSNAKRILFAKLESSLFGQIALFSVAGLAMSLALAFSYDLQIPAQWL